MQNYNKLDVAAKLFPSVSNKSNTSVFRISVVLKEEVDPRILQLAVNMIYERFSSFFMRLRRGFFWNYFDRNHLHFTVQHENKSPCNGLLSFENKGYIVKVLYHKNRISVEAFHSIADGSGVIEFVKSLVYYYITIKHGDFDPQGKILLFDEKVINDKDSFIEHFGDLKKAKKQFKNKTESCFKIKGKKYKKRGNSVITGVVDISDLKKYCKQNGCSITAYLVAEIIFAIYNQKQKNTYNNKPVVVAVPVNLRQHFKSTTLKNFFGIVDISCKLTDDTDFLQLLNSVSCQLKSANDPEYLETITKKHVKISKNILSRYTPLALKNVVIPIGFNIMNDAKKTISLSNIGTLSFPDGIKPFIKHTEVFAYPTVKRPISCTVCSFEQKLSINFIKSITDKTVIQHFFTSIANKTGACVSVYSNMWGEQNE